MRNTPLTSTPVPDSTDVADVPTHLYNALVALEKFGVIRCTSSTRPSTPVAGMTIYETDTKFLLEWNSTASAWQKPWNSEWGIVYSGVPSSITYNTGAGVSSSFVWPCVAGRKYRITVAGEFQAGNPVNQAAIDSVHIRTGVSTDVIAPFFRKMRALANEQFMSRGSSLFTGVSTGNLTWYLYAIGNLDTQARVFQPFEVFIEDIGI